jgi:hypothetical protein
MKKLLLCLLLCSVSPAFAHLPPQEKVLAEIQRIYNGGQNIFQGWKGALASNLGRPEYESMYTFPGTIEPRIKQLAKPGQPVYFYEALLGEGKTKTEIVEAFRSWTQLLSDSLAAKKLSIEAIPDAKDERGIVTTSFVLHPAGTAKDAGSFRLRLDYEQRDDDSLYTAFIQIGYL